MTDTHTREQLPFPAQEDAVMNRYVGQHFAATGQATMYPTGYAETVYRRPWGKIIASAAAIVVVGAGSFLGGRLSAPDGDKHAADVVGANTDTGSAVTASDADALVTQGLSLHAAGKTDEAAALYEQALTKDPKNKFALFNLGQIAHTKQQYSVAIDRYKAALASDPKFSSALYNLGLAYASTNDRPNAISSLRKALEVTPNSAPTLFNLGTLLIQDGQNDEGTKLLNQAFTIDPSLKPKS